MIVHELNRMVLDTGTGVARLPISVAARLTGHEGDRTWPPALALEIAGAALAGFVAGVTGDRELGEEAARRRDAVRELRRASALEVVADAERADADDRLARRRSEARSERTRATRDAGARRAAAKRTAEQRETAAARAEGERRKAARKVEDQQTANAARTARAERLEELEVEEVAVTTAKRAAAKRNRAKAADAGVRASRSRRTNGASSGNGR